MSPDDLTRHVIRSLGALADTVTLYPVRASQVAAYLAAEQVGTSARGVIDIRPIVGDEGDVGVSGEVVFFRTDTVTGGPIVARSWSLQHNDRLYDVQRRIPDEPGGVDFFLQEYR